MKKTICFTPANIDACALWRMMFPHLQLPGSRFLFTGGAPPLNELCESDIICCQRMMTDKNLTFLQHMRAHGLKIIYDLDDNVWQIPKDNPASVWFNRQDIRDGMEACASWADVLTVSTPTLKKVLERNWGHLRNASTKKEIPVLVCENRVDPTFYKPSGRGNDKVIIGWAGSNTHEGDLVHVWPVLQKILTSHHNVEVQLIGHTAPFEHPRLRYRQWSHVSEFPYALREWNWDIFLAPLDSNKFNASKSSIKMQEAGAMRRPCLAGFEPPYQEFCKDDKQISWQLCAAPVAWENRLRRLVEDAQFRESLGNAMYTHTMKYFNIKQSVPEWQQAMEACFA